jgi:hydroxymethylpyrimidine/phosphomethylpyrimidine kinase
LKQVLTIAGSDPGGGAGIQADIKAIQASGAFALSVITSVTAQNTLQVRRAFDLPIDLIADQLDAVFADFEIAALKTGMLSSAEIAETVAGKLEEYAPVNLVVDPVMVAKSGFRLLRPEAEEVLRKKLLPLALLVTPNIPEAEVLAGMRIERPEQVQEAARRIQEYGCQAVLVKGGHLEGAKAVDLLFDGEEFAQYAAERIQTRHTHGTGCTYSAAIAAHLGLGKGLKEAVGAAKEYITEAIRHAPGIGQGRGPVHHFYFLESRR